MSTSAPRILIYLLRRDLRLADNPVLHHLAASNSPQFTHVLPLYVLPANQVEISGFLKPAAKSPYPEARSQVAGFWRCGTHRAKFLAESVWDLKESLGKIGSGLVIRVGMVGDVLQDLLAKYGSSEGTPSGRISAIWMTAEEGVEEKREQRDARNVAEANGVEFKLWRDEKFFIDDRDLPFTDIKDLADVYTTFRKSLEPLRSRPRATLPVPSSLPPLPPAESIPPQADPFTSPESLSSMIDSLHKPLRPSMDVEEPPKWPSGAKSGHPFSGGEFSARKRLSHLISSGAMADYKDTRNGLLGEDYSTKLSAWLALGCVTARQVHASLVAYEDGNSDVPDAWKAAPGFGKGENPGTAAVRFELLWRDYMRLCTRKFGPRLFHVDGFRSDEASENSDGKRKWRFLDRSGGAGDDPAKTRQVVERFRSGRTGIGLIDASQRELFLTGYTSNRARQNVASFLSSHLGIDWRVGAEWYECMLTDYDLSNNWGNWQYVAGVGNDPRQGRKFNPVKQALDYDKGGEYIKTWVEELRDVDVDGAQDGGRKGEEMLMGLFQAWRLPEKEKERLSLKGVEWVEKPLIRIPFAVGNKAGGGFGGDNRRPSGRGRGYRGRGRGGGRAKRLGEVDRAAKQGLLEEGESSVPAS
ncbi:Cryptochrome/DNA photolyase class 1 [Lasiodiplodia theobromae]|nr:Cryptochrome/DNA photolyase class 1 [Lasiodiplodia theobromae]KAF4539512.1 Cryptochrome/DNA photolyase class 1 [Lasiodiplodia theobromae]